MRRSSPIFPTTTSPELRPIRTAKATPPRPLHLLRVPPQLLLQVQRRPARPLRVVLMRDRGAEEGHDAVAGVLVHRHLEAVHALGEDREEAVEYLVPLLGIDLLRQLHRALYVGE